MKGHIATKGKRHYPVVSLRDPATGKWKRKWMSGHRTKREAQRALTQAVAEINNGHVTVLIRKTVAELCNDFLVNKSMSVRPTTLESYRYMLLSYLVANMGAKPATGLAAEDLNRGSHVEYARRRVVSDHGQVFPKGSPMPCSKTL